MAKHPSRKRGLQLPPLTLLLWDYQLTLLIRPLRTYKPTDPAEESERKEYLEILETIARQQ